MMKSKHITIFAVLLIIALLLSGFRTIPPSATKGGALKTNQAKAVGVCIVDREQKFFKNYALYNEEENADPRFKGMIELKILPDEKKNKELDQGDFTIPDKIEAPFDYDFCYIYEEINEKEVHTSYAWADGAGKVDSHLTSKEEDDKKINELLVNIIIHSKLSKEVSINVMPIYRIDDKLYARQEHASMSSSNTAQISNTLSFTDTKEIVIGNEIEKIEDLSTYHVTVLPSDYDSEVFLLQYDADMNLLEKSKEKVEDLKESFKVRSDTQQLLVMQDNKSDGLEQNIQCIKLDENDQYFNVFADYNDRFYQEKSIAIIK